MTLSCVFIAATASGGRLIVGAGSDVAPLRVDMTVDAPLLVGGVPPFPPVCLMARPSVHTSGARCLPIKRLIQGVRCVTC